MRWSECSVSPFGGTATRSPLWDKGCATPAQRSTPPRRCARRLPLGGASRAHRAAARRAEGERHHPGARRLRHRLRLALIPAALPGRHRQDRPQLHRRDRLRNRRPRTAEGDHRPRQRTRAQPRRRGHPDTRTTRKSSEASAATAPRASTSATPPPRRSASSPTIIGRRHSPARVKSPGNGRPRAAYRLTADRCRACRCKNRFRTSQSTPTLPTSRFSCATCSTRSCCRCATTAAASNLTTAVAAAQLTSASTR
jgi:hypothetical protein